MAEVGAALTLLVLAALLPGTALACRLRLETRTRLDAALAVVALGITASGSAVYVLLFCGLYTRWAAAALLLAPALWLSALALRRDSRLTRLWRVPGDERADRPTSRLDHAVLALCLLWLALAFVDAATSPPRFWDGIVTWDKWAMDWGHRHSLRGYLFAYSQLLPMFSSLAYKLLATVDGDLPPALCGVHALHPLLGLVLLTAMWRLARLLGLPAWAALIALFGTRVLQDHVGAGTADLLVTTLGTTAVALHVASWREPPAAAWRWVVGVTLFGALAAKATGASAALSLLALHAAWRRAPAAPLPRPAASTRSVTLLVVAAAALNVLPMAQQFVAAATTPTATLDPTEVNFRLTAVHGMLASSLKVAPPTTDVLGTVIASWGAPAHWHTAFALPLGAFILGALLDRRVRLLCLPVAAHVLVWSQAFSYDLRNLMPSLPFAALLLVCGGQFLARRAVDADARAIYAAVVLFAVSPMASTLVTTGHERVSELTQRDFGLPQRLAALRDGVDARVFQFYLPYQGDYAYLRALDPQRHGARLLAASPLYRCFAHASYPICEFAWTRLRAGDVYVAWPQWQPPGARWTLVREDPRSKQRTWIFTPNARRVPAQRLALTGTHPPLALRQAPGFTLVRFSGPQSLIAFDALRESPAPGSWIVWRLTVETADSADCVRPFHMAYDPDIIDAAVSTTMVESGSQPSLRTYSGILVLRDRPLSTRLEDGLLVGIDGACADAGARVFGLEYSLLPPRSPAP